MARMPSGHLLITERTKTAAAAAAAVEDDIVRPAAFHVGIYAVKKGSPHNAFRSR